jgi:O-antigen biosynthesis protein WbqP
MRISPLNSENAMSATALTRSARKGSSRVYDVCKRAFDLVFAVVLLPLLALPMLLVAALVRFSSPGPVIFWSDRVGRNNVIFRMPKFRTMYANAPQLATNLMAEFEYTTKIGAFLRRSSLDELPQLFSILAGRMSFVGPRPALFNQYELIEFRTRAGIPAAIPGITGWAQINGRDYCTDEQKTQYDADYLRRRSFWFDIKILLMTVPRVLSRQGISG